MVGGYAGHVSSYQISLLNRFLARPPSPGISTALVLLKLNKFCYLFFEYLLNQLHCTVRCSKITFDDKRIPILWHCLFTKLYWFSAVRLPQRCPDILGWLSAVRLSQRCPDILGWLSAVRLSQRCPDTLGWLSAVWWPNTFWKSTVIGLSNWEEEQNSILKVSWHCHCKIFYMK